jgi:hypothetical protein
MPPRLPLSALLSQALVAFTIEFDNEFEHLAPHRTSVHGPAPRSPESPWLVSMVMYAKFLRFVPAEGISFRDMQRQTQIPAAELRVWLTRLAKWWNYITIGPNPASSPASASASKPDWIIRPTHGGLNAIEVWTPLTNTIEQRWRHRFGKTKLEALRVSLQHLVGLMPPGLPASLPILGVGLVSKPPQNSPIAHEPADAYENSLPALLSKALFAFAIAFERDSEVALAISVNILRILDETRTSLNELPRRASVSKEAVAMSLTFLQKRGYVGVAKAGPESRGKAVTLTAKGQNAKRAYYSLTQAIEHRWADEFGQARPAALRAALEPLVDSAGSQPSPC